MSAPAPGVDAGAALRSRRYLGLLLLAALIGVPISVAAYAFLAIVLKLQTWVYQDLPAALGYATPPAWWPVPFLALAGLLVGATIRYLPGTAGHIPAKGFSSAGAPGPAELPGVILAALAGLGLGIVLGPEAPLIALGGGLAVIALRLSRRAGTTDGAGSAVPVVGAAGSFAAVSALLGSPLLGAFLLMEASGLGGATMSLVLVPGLLSAGIGTLIFVGLGHWTGLGPLSLQIPDLPDVGPPTAAQFAWAIGIAVLAAFTGTAIRRASLWLEEWASRRAIVAAVGAGLVVGGLALAYQAITDRPGTDVLFSGQQAIGPLILHGGSAAAGALVALLACKSLAYLVSLAAFRGGPIFPSMFIGAAGGIALSHLPGLPAIAGAAMGMGAMSVVMLRLPLTCVLLATLLLFKDGLALMPLVIVAVVCAHVLTAHLTPAPPTSPRS